MLITIERVILLKGVEFFSEIQEESLYELAKVLKEVYIKAGNTFINPGDKGESMYIIIEGQLRIHDANDQTLEIRKQFESIGEMALIESAPRSAFVTAVVDSRLFELDQAVFSELISVHSDVALGVMRVLAKRLRELEEKEH